MEGKIQTTKTMDNENEVQKYEENGQVQAAGSGGLSLSNPADVMSFANTLRKFITENKLSTTIQKSEYVNVDGWKFAGLNFGVTAIPDEPENISSEKPLKVFYKKDVEGNTSIIGITSNEDEIARLNERKPEKVRTIPNYKYKCNCRIINLKTGEQIGFGNAMCSNEEKKKVSFDEYAISSMSQTRAIGKAFRNLLGFIMNAAGFEDTPAEEMTEDYAKNSYKKEQKQSIKYITEDQKEEIQKILKKEVLADIREATLSAMDKFSEERAANCISYLKNEIKAREKVIEDEQNR